MYATICAKKKEDGKIRFWAIISEKKEDSEEFIDASITCRLSDKAKDVFMDNMQDTRNKDIKLLRCDIAEFWLNPAEITKGERKGETFVYLFVNRINPAKKEKKGW